MSNLSSDFNTYFPEAAFVRQELSNTYRALAETADNDDRTAELSELQIQIVDRVSAIGNKSTVSLELRITPGVLTKKLREVLSILGVENEREAVIELWTKGLLSSDIKRVETRNLGDKHLRVIRALYEGLKDDEIAAQLGIKPVSVSTYVSDVNRVIAPQGGGGKLVLLRSALDQGLLPVKQNKNYADIVNKTKRLTAALGSLGLEDEDGLSGKKPDALLWPHEIPPIIYRHGVRTDWAASLMAEFPNRPMTLLDVARVIFSDRYSNTPDETLANQVTSMFSSSYVNERLSLAGLRAEIIVADSKLEGSRRRVISGNDTERTIDDTKRPSRKELRAYALHLWREEVQSQANKAWEEHIEARSRKSPKALSEDLYEHEEEQTRREITRWMKDEAAQDRAEARQWKEHLRRRSQLKLQSALEWRMHENEKRRQERRQRDIADIAIDALYKSGIINKREWQEELRMITAEIAEAEARLKAQEERTIREKQSSESEANLIIPRFLIATAALDEQPWPGEEETQGQKPEETDTSHNNGQPGTQTQKQFSKKYTKRRSDVAAFRRWEDIAEQNGEELEWKLRAGILRRDGRIEFTPAQTKVLQALEGGISLERVATTIGISEESIIAFLKEGYKRMNSLTKLGAQNLSKKQTSLK